MKYSWTRAAAGLFVIAFLLTNRPAYGNVPKTMPGAVEVLGKQLLRDGSPWVPHGFYQIAFEIAPADRTRAFHSFWATAQDHYTPEEYSRMRAAGADMVRIQIAQAGADSQSATFDRKFLDRALAAVRMARRVGLTVIICIQGESHVPNVRPISLPDEGTRRVWATIAPQFITDRGVLFELFNEPHPSPTPQNWRTWKLTMTRTLQTVRNSGAENVVVADGLATGQVLDGAPLLDDPQVAYASHPYAFAPFGQSKAAWDQKFGEFSRRAPVIITEWQFGLYYCDADTAAATVRFLQYINARGIGVAVGIWDWPPASTGSVRWGFPFGKFSMFEGRLCHQPGYGLGRVIERWYTTGTPADSLL